MKHGPGTTENEMDRREFIRLAVMSSALIAGSSQLLEGEETAQGSVAYSGALRALAPGAVRPEGWLRGYLEKQAAELGSKLPQVSWPFTKAYWAEEQEGESWWPWEQKGYWIDGATRLALVLKDEQLLAQVRKPIEYTLTHADTEGYLGPEFFQDPKGDYHRWPQNVFFRGLSAYADGQSLREATAKRIAEAMQRHYLSDDASYGTPVRNITNVEDMLWCYEQTGDPRLLALAEKSWREYMTVAGVQEQGDLSFLHVIADAPIIAHGVTYAEISKQPAILYMYTGKEEYLKFAVAAQRRVLDHHMLIDGIPSSTEFFRTITSLDSHETCDIADHTWSWGYLLLATGDAAWADRVERACFNAGPGAIKNDWKALQYFSCPNQFLATFDSNHNSNATGGFQMAYQPNPGQFVACCGGNVHRIFPNYVIRMWMKSNDGGLAAVLYGPSRVNTTVGTEGQQIEIVQTTNYPFEDEIHFKINAERAVTFPLSLRIPGWCDAPRLTVNGAPVSVARTKNGFVVLHRTFHPGDHIALTLPMKIAVTHWPQNGMGIERGPLVYSLPIKENWTPMQVPKYTTAEFPGWEATPASAWNYGIALDPAKLGSEIEIKKRPLTQAEADDPWENPSTMLTVPAKKIEDWELVSNPEKLSQKFTPPLPDLSVSKVSETVERVTLVPYGSTKLRVTIFPALRG